MTPPAGRSSRNSPEWRSSGFRTKAARQRLPGSRPLECGLHVAKGGLEELTRGRVLKVGLLARIADRNQTVAELAEIVGFEQEIARQFPSVFQKKP